MGLTGIYNPGAPETKKVSVFFNTNNGNIALEQRCETRVHDTQDPDYTASSTDQPGHIVTSSQVASANLNGLTLVFGVTAQVTKSVKKASAVVDESCDCDPTSNDVSLVSPIYRSLTQTDVGNYSLAASASDDSVFIFYLSGATGTVPELMEETLGDATSQEYGGAANITPGSSLASYYNPDEDFRYCIYQAGYQLCEISSDGPNTPLKYPSVEKDDPTPLGVVYVPESKKSYLYYRKNDKTLRKCVKQNGVWGSEEQVGNTSHPVADGSQITVVHADGANHIFYVADGVTSGGGKFEHVVDPKL